MQFVKRSNQTRQNEKSLADSIVFFVCALRYGLIVETDT